jgi:hypothetical protein
VLRVLELILSFGMITAMFALIFRFMPQERPKWRAAWIGAAVTALLFTVGTYLIGLYLGRSSVTSGFGAAGSLAVLLVWVYYSAQIFLLGAEFTWVYSREFAARTTRPDVAEPFTMGSVARPPGLVLAGPSPSRRAALQRDQNAPLMDGTSAMATDLDRTTYPGVARLALVLGAGAVLGLVAWLVAPHRRPCSPSDPGKA